MLWVVLLLIILLLVWILLSPLEFKIDTRVPVIMIRWNAIGSATLLFENEEWWLKIRVLFFAKKWNLIHKGYNQIYLLQVIISFNWLF